MNESKRRKRIKNFNSNKLLTRLPILLAQIKAGNNSNKLKTEFRQILCLLYQHNKITKKAYNSLIKSWWHVYDSVIDPKAFCFNFDGPKDVDENLKHEIKFVTKSNEFLADNKIKNEIEKSLLKYKHGNNINEYRKQ